MITTQPSHQFERIFSTAHLHAPKNLDTDSISQLSKWQQSKLPLYLEIGAGKGKHALLFAKENPESRLIAVERTSEKFTAFDKQASVDILENLIYIHADAIAFTAHFIAPNTLDGAFILYPNPEPSNKNQRWLNMPFFEFLLSRLKPNAQIVLASNITAYINEACARLDEVWQLPYQKRVIDKQSARTHFEIKYLARGEHCQELLIKKPEGYRTRFDNFSAKGDM
ncbi:SAM-dependent methyltransferase [Moraxella cuniculi]|uniref:tRNA (guanine(46)-N(7))-methyltransferase n=1 Tax=Moraxella cuniculi TaxID=34061 RepID=A0A448GY17_9GAMM|nr:SAM-dependent methyltransferase [Moraxella cuniculi]VEG13609.1 tRNA (guanine-N(7)-)-methyltransferase [Moraxella cuniculi]